MSEGSAEHGERKEGDRKKRDREWDRNKVHLCESAMEGTERERESERETEKNGRAYTIRISEGDRTTRARITSATVCERKIGRERERRETKDVVGHYLDASGSEEDGTSRSHVKTREKLKEENLEYQQVKGRKE